MFKFCNVNFNIDGSFNDKSYVYKTKVEGLKEGDIVLVQAKDEVKRARFEEYVDSVDYPVDKIKELYEKF